MLQLSKRTWNIELIDMHGVERSIQLLGNRLTGLTFPWKRHILNSRTCVVNAQLFRSQPESAINHVIIY